MAAGVDEKRELQFQLAQERLALYFRSLGFDDKAVEVAIRTVKERLPPASPDASDTELAREASEAAMSLVRQWLDQSVPPSDVVPGQAQRPVLWRLRAKLLQQPGQLEDVEDLPEAILRLMRESCRPILPAERRVPMLAQPLGAVPCVLQGAFWRRTAHRFISRGRKVMCLLSAR